MLFAAAFLLAASTSPCDTSQTQSDLDVCWRNRADAADAQLNATYARVKAGITKYGVSQDGFVAAELAWIAARDKTCAFEQSLYEGGSIAPMIYSECVDRMTRARTQRLSTYFERMQQNAVSTGTGATRQPLSPSVDAHLNKFYQALETRLTKPQLQLLQSAEIAWLTYRDKACALEGYDCLNELENERIAEFQAGWLGESFW